MKEQLAKEKYTKETTEPNSRFSAWLNFQLISYEAYEMTLKEENQVYENKQI